MFNDNTFCPLFCCWYIVKRKKLLCSPSYLSKIESNTHYSWIISTIILHVIGLMACRALSFSKSVLESYQSMFSIT